MFFFFFADADDRFRPLVRTPPRRLHGPRLPLRAQELEAPATGKKYTTHHIYYGQTHTYSMNQSPPFPSNSLAWTTATFTGFVI